MSSVPDAAVDELETGKLKLNAAIGILINAWISHGVMVELVETEAGRWSMLELLEAAHAHLERAHREAAA